MTTPDAAIIAYHRVLAAAEALGMTEMVLVRSLDTRDGFYLCCMDEWRWHINSLPEGAQLSSHWTVFVSESDGLIRGLYDERGDGAPVFLLTDEGAHPDDASAVHDLLRRTVF